MIKTTAAQLAILAAAMVPMIASAGTVVQLEGVQLKQTSRSNINFTEITASNMPNSQVVGAPSLPTKTFLVAARPEEFEVRVTTMRSQVIENVIPAPAQEQPCRCEDDKKRTFQFNEAAYERGAAPVDKKYIGSFRGQPVTMVNVAMAKFDAKSQGVILEEQNDIEITAPLFEFMPGQYKDFLIIAPEQLVAGVKEFADWKTSQGYNVTVRTILVPEKTTAGIAAIIKAAYTDSGTDFVMLVGSETELPMFNAKTSGGSTPSDLKYFTMDGADDNVPDMFSSRVVGLTSESVATLLAKSIEFDQKNFKDKTHLHHIIGIASNEGSNPSDNEYVQSIEKKFESAFSYSKTHFFQNDKMSVPEKLNAALDAGAQWLVYLGHGSGTSWPSMYSSYGVNHIEKLRNERAVKPVIIDVACQNGRLVPGYLGSGFAKILTGTEAFGSSAYYGGTVNISWHPPAVMARGIAFEHTAKNFTHLGEALLAGQIYLAKNWTSADAIIDNLEWYHLQGDPSMIVRH